MNNEQMLLIPSSFAQQLHDYLYTRPMHEVEDMVLKLRMLTPIVPPAPPIHNPNTNGDTEPTED